MADPITALLTGDQEKKAAGRASDAQTRAANIGIAESRARYEDFKNINNPYVQAGYAALGGGQPPSYDQSTIGPNASGQIGGGSGSVGKGLIGSAIGTQGGSRIGPREDGSLSFFQGVGSEGVGGVRSLASGLDKNVSILGDATGRTGQNLDITQQYAQSGIPALQQQQNLAGLGDPGSQAAAIEAISGGPEMQAILAQGENALLQNASATGGLRGGNTAAALAQFRPQILSSLIDKQYGRLGGLSETGRISAQNLGASGLNTAQYLAGAGGNMAQYLAGSGQSAAGQIAQLGQASAAGTGAAGVQTGQNISSLMGNIGSAQAGAEMARARPYQMFNQARQSNSNTFGNLFAGGM